MVKFGFKNGFQRYQCRVCKRTRSDMPENPLGELRVPMAKAVQVINLLCESTGIRACERLTGLNRRTVLNILELAGQKAASFLDAKVRNMKADLIQADEIHSFVYSKQQNTDGRCLTVRGEQFTFLAVDRQSKMILSYLVGKRTRENADSFLFDLKSRVATRFQLTTDNWRIYAGYQGAVKNVFGQDVDYATETKVFAGRELYLPRRILSIRRKARIGQPDMELATTCHAERTNLSVRLFNRRFTRCTLGYSKKLDNLKHAVALFVWHFNFVRKHSTLSQTPAQAAGIIENPMTIEDLLSV
jgi:IS1 family transposase